MGHFTCQPEKAVPFFEAFPGVKTLHLNFGSVLSHFVNALQTRPVILPGLHTFKVSRLKMVHPLDEAGLWDILSSWNDNDVLVKKILIDVDGFNYEESPGLRLIMESQGQIGFFAESETEDEGDNDNNEDTDEDEDDEDTDENEDDEDIDEDDEDSQGERSEESGKEEDGYWMMNEGDISW